MHFLVYATGMLPEDMQKAQIGVCSMGYQGNPCNRHLNQLASIISESIQSTKKLYPMQFNTIGVSDAISMGTRGMSFSLPSRDLIADSIESVMSAQWYDALVTVPGCDKNMPGSVIAMARLNRPAIMVYGGTIKPGKGTCGKVKGKSLDIVSAFQSYGEYIAGEITDIERADIVRHACPGSGACGGMYTANTSISIFYHFVQDIFMRFVVASAIEAMGLTLPYSSSIPAEDPQKQQECENIGSFMLNLIEKDIKPRDILTKKSLENAITITMALGGSTNAVLHLIAIARTLDIPLSLDDFQRISDKTPYIADLKPSGRFVMQDLHLVGGTPAVLKLLLKAGLIHGDIMTVTGKSLSENVENLPDLTPGQKVIHHVSNPIKTTGHIQILRGFLAPEGAVAKITGKEGLKFKGPAKVFDGEDVMLHALERGEIKKGQVVVIRYEGPKGGPGMPEMRKSCLLY